MGGRVAFCHATADTNLPFRPRKAGVGRVSLLGGSGVDEVHQGINFGSGEGQVGHGVAAFGAFWGVGQELAQVGGIVAVC